MFSTEWNVKSFLQMVLSLSLGFIFILSNSITTFAFDDNYIGNQKYWAKIKNIETVSEDNFQGFVKYNLDKDNYCAYFFINFNDDEIKNMNSKNIYLGFDISNSENTYSFKLNENGLENDDEVINNNLNIEYDFSNLNIKYGGGNIFIGIELLNKADQKLCNYISCQFFQGKSNNITLLDELKFDLFVPTTTKSTTTKATTEKITTTKITTAKITTTKITTTKITTQKVTTEKSTTQEKTTKAIESSTSKSTIEKTTKFDATTKKSKKETTKQKTTTNKTTSKSSKKSTTKFSIESTNQSEQENIYDETTVDDISQENNYLEEIEQTQATSNNLEQENKSVLTAQSKIGIIIATVTCATGIAMLIIAIIKNKKNKNIDE